MNRPPDFAKWAQRFAALEFEVEAMQCFVDVHPAACGGMQALGQAGCRLREQAARAMQCRCDQALGRRGPGHEGLADVADQDDGRGCEG